MSGDGDGSRAFGVSTGGPTKADASLMTLPTELRLKIYEQVYLPEDTQPETLRSSTPPNLSLPRTCRQIYNECLPVLLSTAPFALSEKRLAGTRVKTVLGFLKALGDKLALVRRLDILWDSRAAVEEKVMAKFVPTDAFDEFLRHGAPSGQDRQQMEMDSYLSTFITSCAMEDKKRLSLLLEEEFMDTMCEAIDLIAAQSEKLDYLALTLPVLGRRGRRSAFATMYILHQSRVVDALLKVRGVKRLAIWNPWRLDHPADLAKKMRATEAAIYWSEHLVSTANALKPYALRAGWKVGGRLETQWVLQCVIPETEAS